MFLFMDLFKVNYLKIEIIVRVYSLGGWRINDAQHTVKVQKLVDDSWKYNNHSGGK